jgi:serine/threonine-protein kinase RsbW
MEVAFTLCLPHDEASVPVVRHLISSTLNRLGVDESCISDVQIAVTEACSNVLKHADGQRDDYEVRVGVFPDSCEIHVTDLGVGLAPGVLERMPAGVEDESGRGVQLMRALVDQLQFVAGPSAGLSVRFLKRLSLRDGAVMRRLSEASHASTS